MNGMDFPPRDDKKKVLKSFDGLDEALNIKRAGESIDGSGASHEGNQEAVLDALARFEQSWSQADARHAAFMEAGAGGWAAFKTYMDERQSEVEAIRDMAKANPALSAALTPLLVSVDKSFGKFNKAGTSMMGQGILEKPELFGNINEGVKVLADATPASGGKNERDRNRQKRGGKSAGAPEADTVEAPPVGLFGGKGDKSAEMQSEIDAGPTLEEQRLASRNAMRDYEPSTPADGLTLAEQAAAVKAGLKDLKPSTETDGPTLAEQAAAVRKSIGTVDVAPEAEEVATDALISPEEASAEVEKDAIADPTLKETKASLREGVAKIEMENLKRQEETVREAQDKYFAALAERQKNRGSLTVIAENFTGDLGGSKELKALRTAWVRARAGHAFTQQAALNARLTEAKTPRDEMLERLKSKTEKYAGQFDIQKRYERMVTVRSVVTGAEEAERAVSEEALNNRDKKTVEKMNDWYMKKVPASVRIFGTSAALFGGAALLAGNPIGLAALGLVGTSAALRFWAEKTNGPILKSVLTNGARFTSIPGAFGALADYGVRLGHSIAGTETDAASTLAQREGLGNLASMKNLEHLSNERKKALAAKETIARHGRLAGILTSIGAGWLFGHFGPGHHQAPAGDTETTPAHDGPGHHPAGTGKVETTPAPAVTAPAPAPVEAVPVAPVHPTTPDGLLVGATIHRPGEGFGEMIQEFKHNFHEQLPTVTEPSPALAHVLNTDPNVLTHDIDVASGGQSLTMQPGDQFVADENQNIWFQPKGGEPQLVFENDPTAPGGFITHDIHGHMQTDLVHHETPKVASPEGGTAPAEDPSAGLNRAQYTETLTARTDFPDGTGITTLTQPESLDTTSGLQFTEHPTGTPEVAATAQPAVAPEVAPVAHPVAAPEAAPAPHVPAPKAAAPTPAPEAAPAPVPAPEAAPVSAPEAVSTGPHPFASPDAPPLLNENGVDLNKPQVLLNEGRWFAHGANVDDSYDRAVAQSQALARAGEPSNVYFVVPDTDVTGREILAVRMVFTPPDGSAPQMAPFGEGLQTGAQFTMPPLPNDADYKLPPAK